MGAPKAKFSKKVTDSDYLLVSVWNGKKHPEDEIIRIEVSKKLDETTWKPEFGISLYRTKEGKYLELKPRPEQDNKPKNLEQFMSNK